MKTKIFVALASLVLVVTNAYSSPLNENLTNRPGFSVSGVNATSYDSPEFNAFSPFDGFLSSEISAVNTFTGGKNGSNLEFFFLSEAAFYDGNHGAGANNFGITDQDGNFTSVVDSATADAGFSTQIFQEAGDELSFTLKSPESDFSSTDSKNSDNQAHILGREVTKNGSVTIDNADLQGLSASVTFNLLVGDVVLFIEDLLAGDNMLFSDFFPGDFDYNDMVIVVRQTEVPEPATAALLGFGLLGAGARGRKRKLQRNG